MKLKPCPCCGNANLYKGHINATTMGVECMDITNAGWGCGLSLGVGFTSGVEMKRGEGFPKYKSRLLAEAVKRWNRRVTLKSTQV